MNAGGGQRHFYSPLGSGRASRGSWYEGQVLCRRLLSLQTSDQENTAVLFTEKESEQLKFASYFSLWLLASEFARSGGPGGGRGREPEASPSRLQG